MNGFFYGYVFEPTGYGAAARAYVRALHGAGVNVSVVSLGHRQFVRDPLTESLLYKPIRKPMFHLCHTPPRSAVLLNRHFDGPIIAITAWETDRLPAPWTESLSRVLEVWVPCSHNTEIFKSRLTTPIFCLPHPFVPHSAGPDAARAIRDTLGLKESDFVFYAICTWQERKYPLGIIDAFLKAFPDEANVILVLKTRWNLVPKSIALAQIARYVCQTTSNNSVRNILSTSHQNAEHECIRLNERVRIIGADWTDEWLAALAELGHCYVSLHRGEGWGYPLFDAACSGTPVICTNYSGPTDYLTSEFHNLVNYRLAQVAKRGLRFSPDMLWAEPDLSHAACLMRYVYENQREALERAQRGASRLRQEYSLDRVGEAAANR